jgi:D-threo-aldose 1-dehydrogenase
MDPIARRPLGKSSLSVTSFGFGTAPLGGFRARIPEAEAVATISTAYDAGVRFFDTSPYYGYGRSELRLGAALRDMPRADLVISTKIGRWMTPVRPGMDTSGLRQGGLDFAPTFDYSYDGVMRSLEQSWLRLGMNRIDVVFIHDVDFWTIGDHAVLEQRFAQVVDDGYRALDELRRAGVIGAIGVGLNEVDISSRFVRALDLDCVLLAGRYTLLEQGALDGFLPLCTERGVGVVIGGPFNSGILATGAVPGAKFDYADPPPHVIERVNRIEAVCRRHGVPLAAAALQFPLAHPAVSATIPGAMNRGEIAANLALFRTGIPAALWAELRHEGLLDARAPIP